MLNGKAILIVEDEAIIALELAAAVREAGGAVIGPAPSVEIAFSLLDRHMVVAAILDANLTDRDITPLALELHKQRVPFVVHTGKGLPVELAHALPDIPLVMKPAESSHVVSAMISAIDEQTT